MKQRLIIGWLYPELMSTYGDRGNIIILKNRCLWRGIDAVVYPIDFKSSPTDIGKCSIIVGGGAQDRQQGIVITDLLAHKKTILANMFKDGTPGLFVCGSPQLLGDYYTTGDGTKLEGLGIFDMVSEHPGSDEPRLIGNTVSAISDVYRLEGLEYRQTVVGFENHGGRTYLGNSIQPFAKVLYGNGNNGQDGTEGAVYRNCIATYSHGPFLTKNPHIADWLIHTAMEHAGFPDLRLSALDDSLAWTAHEAILRRFMK